MSSSLSVLALSFLTLTACSYDERDDGLPGRSLPSAPSWVTPATPAPAPVAELAPETPQDRALQDDIAARISTDEALSYRATHVEIAARGAVVTLRGDVRSEAERQALERHARATAGVLTVRNELTVTF